MKGQMTIWDYLNPTDDLTECMKAGSQFEGGKVRIYALYLHEHDKRKRVQFLKDEYGTGGRSYTLLNGESGFIDFRPKGITIRSFRSDYEKEHTWREAEESIRELIETGRYMTDRDMDKWNALNEKPYPTAGYRYPA